MRTTLTLDEDVAAKLRRLARQRRESFNEIVNSVLRRSEQFRIRTFRSAFGTGIDRLRLNTVNDEIASWLERPNVDIVDPGPRASAHRP